MKKFIFMLTLITMGLMVTGCDNEKGKVNDTSISTIEERTYIDDEYLKELEFNSQENHWGN